VPSPRARRPRHRRACPSDPTVARKRPADLPGPPAPPAGLPLLIAANEYDWPVRHSSVHAGHVADRPHSRPASAAPGTATKDGQPHNRAICARHPPRHPHPTRHTKSAIRRRAARRTDQASRPALVQAGAREPPLWAPLSARRRPSRAVPNGSICAAVASRPLPRRVAGSRSRMLVSLTRQGLAGSKRRRLIWTWGTC
jgi:hypothetical protein